MHSFKINAKGHGRKEAIRLRVKWSANLGEGKNYKVKQSNRKEGGTYLRSPFDIEERYMNSFESIEEVRWGLNQSLQKPKGDFRTERIIRWACKSRRSYN